MIRAPGEARPTRRYQENIASCTRSNMATR
jgi:hypothetical protein